MRSAAYRQKCKWRKRAKWRGENERENLEFDACYEKTADGKVKKKDKRRI